MGARRLGGSRRMIVAALVASGLMASGLAASGHVAAGLAATERAGSRLSPGYPAQQAPANPTPVLLVPGWADDATTLSALRERFVAAGWPETHVAAITFSNATGSNEQHADEIREAAALLKALTGAAHIDIVAHSMGGLATREWLRRAGDAQLFGGRPVPVRRVVFLGTPHRGTVVASFSWGDGGREMVPGSFFLNRLNSAPPVPEGVQALAIRTPVDTRVIPASSAELRGEGVENLELCCPTHPGLVDDERTFQALLSFLTESSGGVRPAGG
jgi:triacylglycerol lipase